MDWTLQDNTVDDLFFCATLTVRRGGYIPLVQAGAEASDTSAKAVKPHCSWEGDFCRRWVPVSGIKVRSLAGLSNHFTFHRSSDQTAARMLLSGERMSCAAGTNGCLDLRRRTSALDGQVSAEWSRCPRFMARRARDVAPLRQSRLDACENRKFARRCRTQTFSHISQGVVGGRVNEAGMRHEHCGTRRERSTLRLNGPELRWQFASLLFQRPSQSQQAASRVLRVMSTFCEVILSVGDT